MAKKSIGLSKIEMGDIAVDGGMGTVLTQIGATVSDTAVLANDAPTVTDFNIEEQDDPFFSQSTPGKRTVKWDSYNVDPATLPQLVGGTYTAATETDGAKWEAPATAPVIEQSLKITTKDGWVITIPRGTVDVQMEWNFQKTKLAVLHITYTILTPTKAATPPLTIVNPDLAPA